MERLKKIEELQKQQIELLGKLSKEDLLIYEKINIIQYEIDMISNVVLVKKIDI